MVLIMLPDLEIVKKEIVALLKSATSEHSFFRKGELVKVCNWERVQVTDLIEGNYPDSFNYMVKGEGGLGILKNESDCLTEQRIFQLIIKVEGDNVTAIKDNRVEIIDKY